MVTCQLCHEMLQEITSTHLWKHHQITPEQYKKQFPEAIMSDLLEKRINPVLECERCGYTSDVPALVNTDNTINKVLCATCASKLEKEVAALGERFTGLADIEKGAHMMLQGLGKLGLDLADENFTDTPKRIARAYAEIFEGINDTDARVQAILNKAFPSDFDEMVIGKDIVTFSMCPHHFLPVEYNVHVAYIPSKTGDVLGISKLSRVVDLLARRPVLQEQFVEDVVAALSSIKGVQGAACIAYGRHYCMIMRGVKKPQSTTITSCVAGVIKHNAEARNEWLRIIGN